jgi:septum site-determining protein MinD
MIDVDFGLNNLDVIVGVERKIVFDIVDVVEGRCRLRQALVQSDKYKNLFVLSSGKSGLANSVTGQNIKLIIESMNLAFDYILIDCPAGIDLGFHRAVSCADEAIIVVTAGATSLRDADKISAILKSYKMDKISVVVNRVRGDLILGSKVMTPFDIQELLNDE